MSDFQLPGRRLAAVLGATIGLALGARANAAVTHESCAASRLGTPAHLREPALVTRPAFAELANLTGTAGVRVDLATDGSVLGAYVVESSGSRFLDRDAERVAHDARYVAATDGCVAIPTSFRLLVDYTS